MISIAYPLMPKELLLQLESDNDIVHTIYVTIYDVLIEFEKNSKGEFVTATENKIDKSYLSYLIRQLNRLFGNL